MEGNYVETAVKRDTRYVDMLFRALWIGVLVWGAFLLFPINGMITLVYIGIHGILIHYFWNNYKVEYEYVFCDGQIDFDYIIDGKKRKHKLRVQLEDAVYLAKPDNENIVNNQKVHTTLKYISNNESGNIYALIVKKQDKILKILFEPNPKMLKAMKYKLPKKNGVRDIDIEDV